MKLWANDDLNYHKLPYWCFAKNSPLIDTDTDIMNAHAVAGLKEKLHQESAVTDKNQSLSLKHVLYTTDNRLHQLIFRWETYKRGLVSWTP